MLVFAGVSVCIIQESTKPYIFEPFYRVDKSRSRALGGAGLGLSLVHSALQQHNATISAKDGENGGAVFEVLFPKGQETTGKDTVNKVRHYI